MSSQINAPSSEGQVTGIVGLGFFTIAILSFLTLAVMVTTYPQTLLGDPLRTEVLGAGVLALAGFVVSFIFGTIYAVSSLFARTGIWSRKLAVVHFFLHAGGLLWMFAAFAGSDFLYRPMLAILTGVVIIIAGFLLATFNLLLTASRHNRWEPSSVTVISSFFWLAVTTIFALAVMIHRVIPFMDRDPTPLLASHGYLAIVGFLWLGLLGTSLKLFSMFTVSDKTPRAFSWIGFTIINLALLIVVPLAMFGNVFGYQAFAATILVGSLFYFIDIGRLYLSASNRITTGVNAALLGLCSGIFLIGWVAAGAPTSTAEHLEVGGVTARILLVLGIAATTLLVFAGMSMRVIPFVVWRLRCMPLIGRYNQPQVTDLEDRRAEPVWLVCCLLGISYFAAGQTLENSAAIQLGALSLLVGFVWFCFAVGPAIRVFLLGSPLLPIKQEKSDL